jgi:hypothetical protein
MNNDAPAADELTPRQADVDMDGFPILRDQVGKDEVPAALTEQIKAELLQELAPRLRRISQSAITNALQAVTEEFQLELERELELVVRKHLADYLKDIEEPSADAPAGE